MKAGPKLNVPIFKMSMRIKNILGKINIQIIRITRQCIKTATKGTVIQIAKALIKDCLCVSKVS